MQEINCTGAYLDWSGPADVSWLPKKNCSGSASVTGVAEINAGRRFKIGTTIVPGWENNPCPPSFLYPLEASALYTLSSPVSNSRYNLRHFVADYNNGAYVVGWFYDRHNDIPQCAMDQNDIEIYYRDTLWNMSRPALHARKENGDFIQGPVWLACFTIGENAPQEPQWNAVPTAIIHGCGWHVPSWIFYPDCRGPIMHYKVYPLPDEGQRLRRERKQNQTPSQASFDKAIERPREQKNGETDVLAAQNKYAEIQPKPTSELFQRRNLQLDEVKTYWKAEAEKLKLSAKRLVDPQIQWDTSMPTYTDLSVANN